MGVVVMSTDLFEKFGKINPEMGTDSVARQMQQKTVQHSCVNIVEQQVTEGDVPHSETS